MKRQAVLSFKFLSNTILSCVTLLMLFVAAAAQQSGNSTNTGRGSTSSPISHTVRGKIFMPSGGLPDQRIRVVLELNTGGIASETFSDSVGNFEFRNLPNNSYKVTVPGDTRTYETTQETVEAFGNFTRTFTVQIYLREKSNDFAAKPKDKILSIADIQEADAPKAAKKAYEQGVKLARDSKPDDATAKLQEALKIFPDYLKALNKLGEQYMAVNKPADAQAAFERAIAINPKFALPHINLGILLVYQKQYAGAITALEDGIRLDDTYPMGHLNLGLALMSSAPPQFERAEKELLRTLEMGKKDFVHVHKHLFNLYIRQQMMDKAAGQLEAYLREAPEAPDSQDVRQMLGKVKKAMTQQAATSKP